MVFLCGLSGLVDSGRIYQMLNIAEILRKRGVETPRGKVEGESSESTRLVEKLNFLPDDNYYSKIIQKEYPDPRPDLDGDSWLWSLLLSLVNDEKLRGTLHGFRCMGTRIIEGQNGGFIIRPEIGGVQGGWKDAKEYAEARDKWLKPHGGELKKALKNLFQWKSPSLPESLSISTESKAATPSKPTAPPSAEVSQTSMFVTTDRP